MEEIKNCPNSTLILHILTKESYKNGVKYAHPCTTNLESLLLA